MKVRIFKETQIGDRILQRGYEVDSDTMPVFPAAEVLSWIEKGLAEVCVPETESPSVTASELSEEMSDSELPEPHLSQGPQAGVY